MESTLIKEDGIHGGETDKHGRPKWTYFRKDVIDYQQELLYTSRGPWPSPAPGRPLSEYAEVCNLPHEELDDWKNNVSRTYLWILATRFVPGLFWAYFRSGARYADFDDKRFNAHITHGMYSKFLCPLDKGDADLFREQVPAVCYDPARYQKMDFSGMEWVCGKTLPGVYVAPTIVLFEVTQTTSGSPDYRAVAIHIYETDKHQRKIVEQADTLVPSESGEACKRWELAKYFAVQGAVHRISLTEHGRLHFPYDSVNAITKSVLPTTHPLYRLLIPHLRLSLAVDNSVLEGNYSMLSRTNWVVYSPFAAEGKYIRRLIPDAYVGRPGKPNAFPEYSFDPKPNYPNTSFGTFLKKNHGVFHDFVKAVIEDTLPASYAVDDQSGGRRNWEFVALWAESIAEWVPGFPTRGDLLDDADDAALVTANRDLLVKVVTLMLWNLSVAHAADHAGFAAAGPLRNVFRLRVKPPVKGNTVADDFKSRLVKPWDLFQAYLTHELFYKPHNVVDLVDVEYDFSGHPNELRLKQYRDQFIESLKLYDKEERERDPKLPKLKEVSSSIQY